MIRGITKNIAIVPPGLYKDLDPAENFIPASVELRNGFMTDAGNWEKRPGYTEDRDLGVDVPVDLLIPEGDYGYAVTTDGKVFRRTATGSTDITGSGSLLTGEGRPVWFEE